ncbi:unnamed protein product [Blepharisma stoltei]|uniref:Thyroid transcription factor 1-associated protein 26 n=1 Tax=Blepharisma stoltei TaxID=1481888 RepID=A0AAU9K9F5_9CILI|nr:unnamed protein product [Blepharisma stoltei]
MKNPSLKHKLGQRKVKHFKEKKIKEEAKQIEVLEAPDRFKHLYKEMSGGEKARGNELPKPNRFSKSLTYREKAKKEKEKQIKQKAYEERKKHEKEKQKFKTAHLLSAKTKKGQPKLGNLMMHICDKLGVKK